MCQPPPFCSFPVPPCWISRESRLPCTKNLFQLLQWLYKQQLGVISFFRKKSNNSLQLCHIKSRCRWFFVKKFIMSMMTENCNLYLVNLAILCPMKTSKTKRCSGIFNAVMYSGHLRDRYTGVGPKIEGPKTL